MNPNAYREGPNTKSANNEEGDPMTVLGGISLILAALVLIKITIQCFGVDSTNEDEPSNNSYFRLHEAFGPAFSKMMGQGMYVVIVIGCLDIANI